MDSNTTDLTTLNILFYVMQMQTPHNLFGLDFFSVGTIMLAKCCFISLFTVVTVPWQPGILHHMAYFTSSPSIKSWSLNSQLSDLHFLYILREKWGLWNPSILLKCFVHSHSLHSIHFTCCFLINPTHVLVKGYNELQTVAPSLPVMVWTSTLW